MKGKIETELYDYLKPRESLPSRNYGLPKAHKECVPLRPIVSMPGTAYHTLGEWISKCLTKI